MSSRQGLGSGVQGLGFMQQKDSHNAMWAASAQPPRMPPLTCLLYRMAMSENRRPSGSPAECWRGETMAAMLSTTNEHCAASLRDSTTTMCFRPGMKQAKAGGREGGVTGY